MTTELPSKVRRERKPPPSMDQRRVQLDALGRAIDTICASWEPAIEASQSRGYPIQSPGPKAAAGIVKFDPNDPLHTRSMPGASGSSSAFGDATGNAAMQPHTADGWITEATGCLGLLLRMSPADERRFCDTCGGEKFVNGAKCPHCRGSGYEPLGYGDTKSWRWNGQFWPPYLKSTLRQAAEDVVTLWPVNCALLFERIHVLANVARSEWPATLRPGESVIDRESGKEIVVGGTRRAQSGDDCAECGRFVAGDATDPILRIDGKPYHRSPCYNTVYRRNRRRGKPG